MPVVEKVSGGRVYIRSLARQFQIGDRAEVDAETATYLVNVRGDFEVVDDADHGDVREEDGPPDDETNPESEDAADDEDDEDGEDEEDAVENTDPVADAVDGEDFSENGWLDNDYTDRADAVREGGLDDFLDKIEAAETSDTVIQAVKDRRSELGREE